MKMRQSLNQWIVSLLICLASFGNFTIADSIQVIKILPVALHDSIRSECENWKLTKEDVINILLYSDFYDDLNPYSLYYQTNCHIDGEILINNEKWTFSIEGGGIMTLSRPNSQTLYWGCNKKQCEHYILLLTDFMES